MLTPLSRQSVLYTVTNRILCLTALLVMFAGSLLKLTAPTVFVSAFAQEDGPVENLTTLALGLTGLVFICRAIRFWQARRQAALAALVLALAFFWSSGEEISWGQRIFGWDTTGFFATHNRQNETNLHNLVIGGHHLARLLFGNVLTAVVLGYFLLLPPLWQRSGRLRAWIDEHAIPVPAKRHTLLIMGACVMVLIVPDQHRIWEVFEAAFALIALALSINPRNDDIF